MTKDIRLRGVELLLAYSRNPSLKLRNKIVELNIGLARKVAHQINQQCAEPYEDLEQIGSLGLIRAIERFDPLQGNAFSSFAIPYIRGEILHYLRDKGSTMKIPRRWQELHNKGRKLHQRLEATLGRIPSDSELAEALGVSIQEWNECQLAFQNRTPVSLDAVISQSSDTLTLGETLAAPLCQTAQIQEERLLLQKAIEQLETKTKAAIEYVYLRDLPRREAAKQIGVSPMTVTRHLKKGVEQLENLLQLQAA
ncbi:MAG: RNA polymerase sigma factor SigF [Cyanophyceae cyanobacterium]